LPRESGRLHVIKMLVLTSPSWSIGVFA